MFSFVRPSTNEAPCISTKRKWRALAIYMAASAHTSIHERCLDCHTEGCEKTQEYRPRCVLATGNAFLQRSLSHSQLGFAQWAPDVRAGELGIPTVLPAFVRPHAGHSPEQIAFGVFLLDLYKLYHIDYKFNADMVLTLQWTDPRVAALIPDGQVSISLSGSTAEKLLWMPDVQVTNRAINGIDVISYSVVVNRHGNVTKVQRLSCVLKNKFDLHHFPFDKQTLQVGLASTSLMLEELVMFPLIDPNITNISNGALADTPLRLTSVDLFSEETFDGTLHKSRGVFQIKVVRKAGYYVATIVLPIIVIQTVSSTVFFFPLKAPFAMPRVATSYVCVLTLLTLKQKEDADLPNNDTTWISVIQINALLIMMFTLCYNMITEIVYHTFDNKHMALTINFEARVVFCILGLLLYGMAFAVDHDGGPDSLQALHIGSLCLIACSVSVHVFTLVKRFRDFADSSTEPKFEAATSEN